MAWGLIFPNAAHPRRPSAAEAARPVLEGLPLDLLDELLFQCIERKLEDLPMDLWNQPSLRNALNTFTWSTSAVSTGRRSMLEAP